MALIKCPECGKEISDKAGKCPNCGYPIDVQEEKIRVDDGGKILESVDGTTQQENENKRKEKTKLKSKWAIIGGIVLLCIIIGITFISNKNAKILEQQKAEVQEIEDYNTYIDNFNSLYTTTLSGASKAESVCVLTLNVWQDAIFGDLSDETSKYVSGANDFNEALQRVYDDEEIQETLKDVRTAKNSASTYIKNLQSCPSELSKAYDAALEVHTAFSALSDLALEPTGSCNSYSEDEKTKVNAYISAYKTLEAVIPPKKEIPLYNSKGKSVQDEFYFDIYLNQMTNKLPDTVEDKSLPSISSYYTDTITVCGMEGKISYIGGHVIDAITWETENADDEFVNDVLKKLKEKYGEEAMSEDGKYSWNNDETKDSILVTISENGVKINWFNIK